VNSDEIIKLLHDSVFAMDAMDGACLRDKRTGEVIGEISKDEIQAMQTALAFCRHLVEGDYYEGNHVKFIADMIDLHATVKFDLDEDEDD